jgi:hypothetical protein
MGYMDNPMDVGLDNHFKTIVLMLAEGKVTEYEMIQDFEIVRFEKYLRAKRINYNKKSFFPKPGQYREPSFLFSLPEED